VDALATAMCFSDCHVLSRLHCVAECAHAKVYLQYFDAGMGKLSAAHDKAQSQCSGGSKNRAWYVG
jgi:hypothetical protein